MQNHLPMAPVAVTMGDAAGIGPEVVLKALAGDPELRERSVVVGDLAHLRALAGRMGLSISLARTDDLSSKGSLTVLDQKSLPDRFEIGVDSPITGRAAALAIERAVSGCLNKEFAAIATAPISKRSLAMAGIRYAGHTEFIADLTDSPRVAMSFFAGDLRVVLLSTHLPLAEAIKLVRRDDLISLIRFASAELKLLLGRYPRLAVAGLNPHASENGMFGSEEADEIEPAVRFCGDLGIDVSGPYSPDTVFIRCRKGEFDAVIALYHDQATIPVKSMGFGEAVNVTLGLPIIRTSVDHGTAYDIAGKGIADESSMRSAIKLALELCRTRRR